VLFGRAGVFFAEVLTPIEQTHRGAREANLHLNQIIKALSHRTVELADSNEELRMEILLRKTTENTLRESEEAMGVLLEKSQRMQEELRELSRELLTVQEEERRRISRELHDVIAQTLTGINVQLSNLKAESTASTKVSLPGTCGHKIPKLPNRNSHEQPKYQINGRSPHRQALRRDLQIRCRAPASAGRAASRAGRPRPWRQPSLPGSVGGALRH